MKNLFKFKNSVFVLFFALLSVSCSKTESTFIPTAATTPTITEFVAKNSQTFSTLLTALERTGLDKTFNESGTYTVFLPTNAAFDNYFKKLSGTGTPITIATVDLDALKTVLNTHVFSKTIKYSKSITTGVYSTAYDGPVAGTKLSMYLVNKIDTTKPSDATGQLGLTINGVPVTSYDIVAKNGLINIVDTVIDKLSVLDYLKSSEELKTLLNAVTSNATKNNGYGDQSSIATALSSTTPYTLFAPKDDAFKALDVDLLAAAKLYPIPPKPALPDPRSKLKSVQNLAPADITKILQYHVTTGNVLAASLTQGQAVTTWNTQSFTIGLVGGANILDAKNRTSKITTTDIQCTNGVIHLIDKVLLPIGIVLP
jgi:uncharacterized surface protein with fasciclin (FAS1) repeats